jgi:exodeoxyribonuclease V beta subunit
VSFDPLATELPRKLTLIEASAGTGKTYSLTRLVLRLLVEHEVPLREILMVTYTVAATQELKTRVRSLLQQQQQALASPETSGPEAAHLFGKHPHQVAAILDLALQSFDEAQIFTIHGFCQRALQMHAFASGISFGAELLQDPGALHSELANDFLRGWFHGPTGTDLATLHLLKPVQPDALDKLIKILEHHTDAVFLPAPAQPQTPAHIAGDLAACASLGRELVSLWHSDRAAITASLGAVKVNGNKFRTKTINRLFSDLDLAESLTEPLFDSFAYFRTARFSGADPGKGYGIPNHAFFAKCQQFHDLRERLSTALPLEFIRFAKEQLRLRKEQRNQLSYSDLLGRLRDTLCGPDGAPLVAGLRLQYQAVLVDEFQDTDPVQYEIFRRAFHAEGRWLFFIGDPKQAIYGFRGGDIYTYLQAASAAGEPHLLGVNFRSTPLLVSAVNRLFSPSRIPNPFRSEKITYQEVQACKGRHPELTPAQPPLQFRWMDSGDPLTRVAQDIVALSGSGIRLGNRLLSFCDMAVLVRTGYEAADLLQKLRSLGVRAILKTEDSVFDSPEALDLIWLLEAVLNPRSRKAVATALGSQLFGLEASVLFALHSDEDRWQSWAAWFSDARALLFGRGFMALFRWVLRSQKVRERLISAPGGERILTNHLHLAELLHSVSTDRRMALDRLPVWIWEQRGRDSQAAEHHQLRLESDGDAVIVTTIHKSKGLQYPVVFCPSLSSSGGLRNGALPLYHDSRNGHRATVLLSTSAQEKDAIEEARTLAENELQEESLRLLYVALTRAQFLCRIYLRPGKDFAKSPLGHLLAGNSAPSTLETLVQLAPREICVLTDEMDPAISSPLPAPAIPTASPPAFVPVANTFRRAELKRQKISSYSSLTGSGQESRDRDALHAPTPPEGSDGRVPLADFPAGPLAGDFLHKILEQVDFQGPDRLADLIRGSSQSFGIGEEWNAPLALELGKVLSADLLCPSGSRFRLCDIAGGNRRSEAEFYFPLRTACTDDVLNVFRLHGVAEVGSALPEKLERLRLSFSEGYLHGFMDLIFEHHGRFYLLDWKSNRLGTHFSHYTPVGIGACMLEHAYYLQYHLYCLAADLYLRARMRDYSYESHFGGVFYIFLRGVDPQMPGSGIFSDKPPAPLIDALRKLLIPVTP